MRDKILKYIESNHMFSKGDNVIVGLSGGADSVCLFLILTSLAAKLSINLECIHINHMIRGNDALRDEEYCRRICEERKVPFSSVKVPVKDYAKQHHLSEEEAGRMVRYEAFYKRAAMLGNAKIAVAHHMNDQAETVLLNLFRGSGLNGLSGIKPVNGIIVRPLLCVDRQEIEAYLSEQNIEYMQDYTNNTDDYMRNKIRNNIIPYAVENINEGSVENICSAAFFVNQANDFLTQSASAAFRECVSQTEGGLLIKKAEFEKLHDIMKAYVVRIVFEKMTASLKDIGSVHILSVTDLFLHQVSKKINLPYDLTAVRVYEGVLVEKCNGQDTQPEQLPEYEIEIIPWTKEKEIIKNDYTKYLDYDKIKGTLVLRNRQAGDYLIVDSKGSRKKLKDYFTDSKIPASKRASIPLFADGSHIVWIVGFRISEDYKVTSETNRVLKVQVFNNKIHKENGGTIYEK